MLMQNQQGENDVKGPEMEMPRSRKAFFTAVAIGIALVVLEFGFFLFSLFLPASFDYTPPTRERFARYLEQAEERKDIPSGWLPNPDRITPMGYRRSPAGAVSSMARWIAAVFFVRPSPTAPNCDTRRAG